MITSRRSPFSVLPFVLSALFFEATGLAAAPLPPDAQAMLEQFPARAIPLPYVLKRAIESSDRFQAIRTMRGTLDTALLNAHAPLDAVLYARGGLDWNRNRPTTPFGSQRQDSRIVSLGLQKNFFTGTSVGLELTEGYLDLDFGAVFGTAQSYQAITKLSVSQSLLKNFFGDAVRAQLRAGEASRQIQEIDLQDQLDDLVVGTTQAFYSAWSQQAQVRNSTEAVERRQRLFEIVKTRFRRGVAERQDFLSAETALMQSKVQLADQRRQLTDLWVTLVNTLKLPESWRQIDAYAIPLEPYNEVPQAITQCATRPTSLRSIERANLEVQQASEQLASAESQLRPDLSLTGSVAGNGVVLGQTDALSTRWSDAVLMRNPAYSVGLNFNLPLGRFAERAALAQATAGRDRSESMRSIQSVDGFQKWDSLCQEIKLLDQSVRDQTELVARTRERLDLEEQSYRQASQSVYNLIQVGDELSGALFQLRVYDVRARLAAWNLFRLTGIQQTLSGVTIQ